MSLLALQPSAHHLSGPRLGSRGVAHGARQLPGEQNEIFTYHIYIYICQLKYPQKETETKKIEAIHSFYIYSGNQWYRNTI